jgi:microcystin-dependent protein
MRAIQLKSLMIAACCLVASAWTEVQGADEEKDLAAVIGGAAQGGALNAVSEETVPAGSIVAFAGAVAPQGWLLCDGQECSSRDYPKLWKAIKTKYVPAQEEIRVLRFNADEDSGYKIFFVPDLRGRVIVGVDGGARRVTANNKLGASGGEETHQLTVAELASHTHTVRDYGGGPKPAVDGLHDKNSSISPNPQITSVSGGDQPHNNMQPYQVLNYIISTGKPDVLPEAGVQRERIDQLEQRINELKLVKGMLGALTERTSALEISQQKLEERTARMMGYGDTFIMDSGGNIVIDDGIMGLRMGANGSQHTMVFSCKPR